MSEERAEAVTMAESQGGPFQPNSVDPHAKGAAIVAAPFPWQQALLGILGVIGPLLAKWIITTLTSSTPPTEQNNNPPT